MTQTKTAPRTQSRPAERQTSAPICHVCGKPVEEKMDSTCRVCAKPVHISWAQGQPESACSKVVSPQGCCGIAFVCNPCAEAQDLRS